MSDQDLSYVAEPPVDTPFGNKVEASRPEEIEFKPGRSFWLALVPIMVIAFMVSLDGTSVSVALPVRTRISPRVTSWFDLK